MDRASYASQQWFKEKPDIDTAAMILLGRIAEAKQLISRLYINPLFVKYKLQPGEFDVIATLRRSGEPYCLTPTELYEATMISSGSMTNRVNRLEKMGMVKRLANPNDGRGFLVQLTVKGYNLIEELITPYIIMQQQVVSCLSKQEQSQLALLLAKFIEGINNQIR